MKLLLASLGLLFLIACTGSPSAKPQTTLSPQALNYIVHSSSDGGKHLNIINNYTAEFVQGKLVAFTLYNYESTGTAKPYEDECQVTYNMKKGIDTTTCKLLNESSIPQYSLMDARQTVASLQNTSRWKDYIMRSDYNSVLGNVPVENRTNGCNTIQYPSSQTKTVCFYGGKLSSSEISGCVEGSCSRSSITFTFT